MLDLYQSAAGHLAQPVAAAVADVVAPAVPPEVGAAGTQHETA